MDAEQFGIIKEHLRWLSQGLHEMKEDIKEVKSEVKNLNSFKFKVIGAVALAVCLIEIARAKGF